MWTMMAMMNAISRNIYTYVSLLTVLKYKRISYKNISGQSKNKKQCQQRVKSTH